MITFRQRELKDLAKSWGLITLAFTILLTGIGVFSKTLPTISDFVIAFITAAVTVGLGFLLHELAHKIVAERYNCTTEFVADNQMLILAVIMSFFGFIFAAPGAVWISGKVTKEQNGRISAAGPLANLALAAIFIPGMLLLTGTLQAVFGYGFVINAWIGLFNMLPLGNFDGIKIWRWSKVAYFSILVPLGIFVILGFL